MDREQENKIRCVIYDIVEKGGAPGEGLDTWHVERISIGAVNGNQVHFSIDRHPHLFGSPTRGQASSAYATITYFYKLDMENLSIEFLGEERDEPVIDCRMLASGMFEHHDFSEELKNVSGKTEEDVIAYGNEMVDNWINEGTFEGKYIETLTPAQMEELYKCIREEFLYGVTSAWGFEQKVSVSKRALFQRVQ